ncbi:MAG: S41 family peptidase [Gemmatimonadota bacterium]
MKRTRVLATWSLVALLVALASTGFALQSRSQTSSSTRLLEQVLQRVSFDGVDSLAREVVIEKAARGFVEQLDDPYAALYSPEELAAFSRETIGNDYGGLGMMIEDQQGVITVTRVFPDTPAERGGVQPGDRIVEVAGEPIRGWSVERTSTTLLGPPGSSVDVTFARPGMESTFGGGFERARVHQPAVPFVTLLEGDVGYLPLQRFSQASTAELAAGVARLRAAGARAYVLDLRGNGGGSLPEAVSIADLFLPEGREVVRIVYRSQPTEVYRSERPAAAGDAPVVVLTDRFTASASEIVAGALQDHDRALIVGQRSFGKGVVQDVFGLDAGWALKLTTGKWYTPSGRTLQRDWAAHAAGAEAAEAVEGAHGAQGADAAADAHVPAHAADCTAALAVTSAGGRRLCAGGGVFPDHPVAPDSLTGPDRALMRAVGANATQLYFAVHEVALELKEGVGRDFVVLPAWRAMLYERFLAKGGSVERAVFDAGHGIVDQLLERRIAGFAFGDDAAFLRAAVQDTQLQEALRLLRAARTQPELLALVAGARPTG